MNRRKQGFTLMEMLTVVAILAVAAAITVPSVLWLRDAFRMRERNDHARTVYLAAQSRLASLRAGGGLDSLKDCPDAASGAPAGYVYVSGGSGDFDRLLPETVLEEGLRDAQMIAEFNPETGHVFSVFYYEGQLDILRAYTAGQLPRVAKQRREILLGYCDGSDLAQSQLHDCRVKAEMTFENAQAGILRVTVPTQANTAGELTDLTAAGVTRFMAALEITLNVTGERGGSYETVLKPRGSTENCTLGSTEGGAGAVVVTKVLDSLTTGWNLGSILPGDNVSIVAEVTCDLGPEGPAVLVESAAMAGVNPMFGSLTEDSGGWLLTVSNGRHLQNLNSLSPAVAEAITAVLFAGPEGTVGKGEGVIIDWQETANYYGEKLNFIPISNEALLGSLTDPADADRADIVGNGAVVRNLTVDTQGEFAGLFVVLNTCVDGLTLENPAVRAGAESTAGSLAGAVGINGVVTGCGSFVSDPEGAYGVQGGRIAGGLIGSMAGKLSRCFAALPVSGDRAGGLTGIAEGAEFCASYASGYVDGKKAAGGFVGTASDCDFSDCFSTGDAYGEGAVGGFVGRMEAWADTRLESCCSLGLSCRNGEVFENFCGENAEITEDHGVISDFYRAFAPEYLEAGKLPADYRFRDCYYLAGNHPGAAYDSGASGLWANPLDYDSLRKLPEAEKTLLSRLQETPFDSPEALEEAKKFLLGLGVSTDMLDLYEGCGTYQIYFDGAAQLLGEGKLEKQYLAQYAAAFSDTIWDEAEAYPFPMLLGLPYYGAFPERAEVSDYGVMYYERRESGVSFHRVSLLDGQETAAAAVGQVLEAGYGLYFREGTLPFAGESWALAGENIPDLQEAAALPEGFTVRALTGSGLLHITGRYSGRTVSVMPLFADTIGRTEGPYRIHCQSQLESIALFPEDHYLLEGTVKLDDSFSQIPEFRGSLTGADESEVVFSGGETGLIGVLAGGTLEKIRVSGELALTGTAGALADRVRDGKIRDCRVAAAVTATNGEAVGAVAGVLESGFILRTYASESVTGSGGHVGSFLGEALGGTLRDCHGQALPFVGYAAVSGETAISGATHYGLEQLDSDVVDEKSLTALEGAPTARTYAAVFDGCTVSINGEETDIFETIFYYRLTPIGGWRQEKTTASDQFTPAQIDLEAIREAAGTDWAETEYFLFAEEKFIRLLVKQADGGIVFGFISGDTVMESHMVTPQSGTVTEIHFGQSAFPVYGAAAAPESGRYLLVTTDGRVLRMENGMLLRENALGEGALSEDLFWQASAENWANGGGSVGVTRQGRNAYDGESVAVTVSYEETVTVTVTQHDAGGEAQTVTRQENRRRTAECYLYEVSENTDCKAAYLGQSRTLRQ